MKILMSLCVSILLAGLLHSAVIGDMAPELDLGPALKDRKFTLAEMKGKKITVLHFWKTGCPPCAQSVSKINELVAFYRGKVEFLAIGAGMPQELRRESHWKNFQCPVVSDSLLRTVEMYLPKKSSFPMDAVIGTDGKLLWCGSTSMLAGVLGEIMDGKYDLAAAASLNYQLRRIFVVLDSMLLRRLI